MFNLYVWIVGFGIAVFSEPLANVMIRDNVSTERLILMATGLMLMLLSPKN